MKLRLKRVLAALLLPLTGVSCNLGIDAPTNITAESFPPPSVYARWWKMVESCSGLSGSMSAVTWYQVPVVSTFIYAGKPASGYWKSEDNSIVVAGNGMFDGLLVRHEMLHALDRKPGHPRVDFLERCGGVVYCTRDCVKDAGSPPKVNQTLIPLPPEFLQVTVSTIPEHPSSLIDGGVFTVVVEATNPRSNPVIVTSEPSSLTKSFSYLFSNSSISIGSDVTVDDQSRVVFMAGETKRQYFDLVIGSQLSSQVIRPGTYTLSGHFAGGSGLRSGVVIGP
jgi:hypothetical protein